MRGQQTGQCVTNNNNNIIRIITKELRGKQNQGEEGHPRQHLAVASLTERTERSYISIYRFGEDGQGLFFPRGQNSPPGLGLMSTVIR